MAEMKARITLDSDGYSSGVSKVISDTDNMINATKKAKESIEQISNTKIQVNTNEATQSISKMRENIDNIKKNISIMIAVKDSATESINRIKSKAESLTKSNFKFEIAAIDKTSSIISGITDRIFSLKTLMAGLVLGGAGKAGYDWTIGNGISNENYLATLQTVMHDNKKGIEALKWSYQTAQTTPFNAEQVVAGTTQLATSGLDYKKYLTPLGDAAAAFNRPIEQAIFAMGKLKSGQYGMAVDMFRDFGISNQDWTKAGATFKKNGEMNMSDPQKAVDMVTKIINQKYGGLMERKSNTAGGMMSNIGDSISGMGRSLAGIDSEGQIMKGGLFDNFKQQLQVIMPLLDRVQKTQAFKDLQKDISNLATAGGQKLTAFLKSFDDPKKVTQYKNEFKQFMNDVKAGANTAVTFAKAVGTIATALKPIFSLIAAHPNLFMGLFVGYESFKGGAVIIGTLKSIGSELKYLPTALGLLKLSFIDTFKNILTIFKTVGLFMLANPLPILAIIAAVALLYEAWKNDWGGIREYTEGVIKDLKQDWEDLKEFFSHPIDATINYIKSENAKESVTTTRYGAVKQHALGTSYFEGGLTWINEVGPELVELPGGTKIHSNRETKNMLSPKNNQLPNMAFQSTMANQNKSMGPETNKWGQDIPNNLAKGIKNNMKPVTDSVTLMAAKIRELIHFSVPDKGPLSDFDTYSVDMMKTFGTGITENSKYPIKSTNELTKNVAGIFTILGQQSNPLGQSVSQGLGQGMQDSSSNVTDIAKTLTDKVIETFKTGFDIHSPSRVMHEIGSHVMQGFVNGLSSKDLKAFADKQIGTITSAFGAAVNVPGGVNEWLTQALMATGTPLSWLPGLQRLVMAESGGDPGNWNPQAVGGEHATGLLQTLPSTFQEFMQKGMNNILNPVDNAASAINYIKSRYGDVYNTPLFRGGKYVGYANGGIATEPSIFGEAGAEIAIPLKKDNPRSQYLLKQADNLINGGKAITQNIIQKIVPVKLPMVSDIVQNVKQQLIPFKMPKINEVSYNLKNEAKQLKFNTEKIPELKTIDYRSADDKGSSKSNNKPFIINMYGTVVREDADIDKIATALAKKLILAETNMA